MTPEMEAALKKAISDATQYDSPRATSIVVLDDGSIEVTHIHSNDSVSMDMAKGHFAFNMSTKF